MLGSNSNINFSISKPEKDQDWERIEELCRLAAHQPIDKSKWSTFSKKWINPYRKYFSQWVYVANNNNQIVGYLTGCPGTENLPEEFFETEFRSLHLFSKESIEEVKSQYPAHLHVNFDSRFRGLGFGSKLIQRFNEDLQRENISGIHVICGPDPIQFYIKNGFKKIECIQSIKNQPIYLLGFKS